MKQLARFLTVISITTSGICPMGFARGLNQLQPSKDAAPTPPSPAPNPTRIAPQPAEQKAPAATKGEAVVRANTAPTAKKTTEEEKPESKISHSFFLGTSLAWTSLSSDKGGWYSSMASDLIAGFRYAKLLNDRLWLYGTIRYLPVDVVVKHNSQEYRGIVESYLFGTQANYRYKKANFQAGLEVGPTNSTIYAIESYTKDNSLEKDGVNMTLSAGASWSLVEGFQLGTRVYVGGGTFSSIQAAANVSFSL